MREHISQADNTEGDSDELREEEEKPEDVQQRVKRKLAEIRALSITVDG